LLAGFAAHFGQAALALRKEVPTVSPYREFVMAKGLMSYAGSLRD